MPYFNTAATTTVLYCTDEVSVSTRRNQRQGRQPSEVLETIHDAATPTLVCCVCRRRLQPTPLETERSKTPLQRRPTRITTTVYRQPRRNSTNQRNIIFKKHKIIHHFLQEKKKSRDREKFRRARGEASIAACTRTSSFCWSTITSARSAGTGS